MLCATGSRYRPPGAMFLLLELKEFEANGISVEGKTSVSGGICDCCLFSSLVGFALILNNSARDELAKWRATYRIPLCQGPLRCSGTSIHGRFRSICFADSLTVLDQRQIDIVILGFSAHSKPSCLYSWKDDSYEFPERSWIERWNPFCPTSCCIAREYPVSGY